MSISHLLEDFGVYARTKPVSLTDVSLEEHRLEAFEKGYQAGWDDSAKASSDDTRRVSADLAQNLQDLSFTYQEAHTAALMALKPLLEQIMASVLPELLQQSLGAQVVEQIEQMARDQGPQPVELVAAPTDVATLESVLGEEQSIPVRVVEEASMGEGQVFLRFGEQECEINLSGVVESIQQNIIGFYEENRRASA